MTRSDLYITIFPKFVDNLTSIGALSNTYRECILEYIALAQYQEAAGNLYVAINEFKYKKIAKAIQDGIPDDSELMYVLPVRHQSALVNDTTKLMPFCYKSSDLAILPVKEIIKEVEDNSSEDMDSTCNKILDLIWYEYKDDERELDYVWECVKGMHENDYFVLSNKLDNQETNWRLYSYSFLCYVNEHKFDRPEKLNFNPETQFVMSIPYNDGNKYEQYFDAYYVMSESKCSNDVLSRYLRMYQMLEYMAYRRVLADMTKGNIKENGFVRNIINKACKGSTREFDELKNGLKDVLPDLSTIIMPAEISSSMQDFIKNRLMITNTNHDNAKFWEVVYKLRNGIVHNKESELHFMYANTAVYEPGIDLMKLFIQKIEPAIIGVINDPTMSLLEFSEQNVLVY